MTPPQRILALDGLRGMAALAVVETHVTAGGFVRHGGLAVDLFFMLSGFVLAAVYEPRLRAGMTVAAFLKARLARLYPLYATGILIGAALYVGAGGVDTFQNLLANLAFLPWPTGPSDRGLFWLDGPTWSLSLEMIVNVAFALGLWKLSDRSLSILAGLAGAVALVASLRLTPFDFGFRREALDYALGFARVFFGFPLGWLIWRMRDRLVGKLSAAASWLALAGVGLVLLTTDDLTALFGVVVLFPLAVTALAYGPQPNGLLGRVAAFFGALSYPLYVFHAHVVTLADTMLPAETRGPAIWLAAFALAWGAMNSVEPMGRRWIAKALA